jgi:hypothetical protein
MRLTHRGALALALFLVPLASRASAQAGGEVLTNQSIIDLVAGKVPGDLIVAKIKGTKGNYDVSPEGLIALSTGKVSTDNIRLILTTNAASAREKPVLTNEGVIKMVSGGLSKAIIIAKVQNSKPGYDMTTSGLLDLNKNKVSEDVQKAMMASASGTPAKP